MVPQSRGLPSNMQPVVQAPSGPICLQVQQQAPTVCLSGPRPPSMDSGCSQPVMGRTGSIRLPTSGHLGQSGEVLRLPVQQNDTDCTRVAKHALVLGSGSHVQSDSPVSAQPAQSGNSTIQPDPTQKSVKSQPPCLGPRATAIKEQHELRLLKEDQPNQSMRQSGQFLQSGASLIRWTSGHHL